MLKKSRNILIQLDKINYYTIDYKSFFLLDLSQCCQCSGFFTTTPVFIFLISDRQWLQPPLSQPPKDLRQSCGVTCGGSARYYLSGSFCRNRKNGTFITLKYLFFLLLIPLYAVILPTHIQRGNGRYCSNEYNIISFEYNAYIGNILQFQGCFIKTGSWIRYKVSSNWLCVFSDY